MVTRNKVVKIHTFSPNWKRVIIIMMSNFNTIMQWAFTAYSLIAR